MASDLYSSLAAQQSLDSFQKEQVLELAAFSRMLSAFPDGMGNTDSGTSRSCADLAANWSSMNTTTTKPAFASADASNVSFVTAPRSVSGIPFDSPLDHSLASPASTRDFQQSPLQDFDLSGNMDAPLFPDHGTQQTQSDNLLAGLPLFGAEFAWSQQLNITEPTASQSTVVPSNDNDFSFDAIANTMANDFGNMSSNESEQPQTATTIDDFSDLAASFVREYARSHQVHDIDVLLNALRVAGIDVSNEVVSEILATASPQTTSPLVTGFTASSSPSISPMSLPANAAHSHGKHRSSVQASPKDPFTVTVDKQKRFTCPECHKLFDRAFNLRTHMITHVDTDDRDKPYMCPWSDCCKPFSRKYDAERHYRTVHVKRGEIATKKQVEMALSGQFGMPAPSSLAASSSSRSSSIDLANG